MHTARAAVTREPGSVTVEAVHLAEPAAGEVLVDLRASGVCHTDYHFYAGEFDVPMPVVLGHEGAGVVAAVGPNVDRVAVGDHVTLSLLPPCGHCRYCSEGRPYLCQSALDVRFAGTLPGGARRLADADGDPLNHFYAQSSFATAAVVPVESVVPVDDAAPFEVVAPLGCGASTGLGAVFETADVEAGASVAVFGCGGTGASALLAADAVSAGPVIAVDVDGATLDRARALGATHAVDATETDPVERVRDLTGGVAYAFEFVGGDDGVREQAVRAAEPGGTVVLSGAASEGSAVNVFEVIDGGKTLVGNVAGSVRPRVDLPQYVDLYRRGDLPLDELIDPSFGLDEAGAALEAVGSGHPRKPVLVYD
ncbi:MAG: alcohol dehydrogenase catalytic domain-containing protein [Haloarculaceae archaeon]